MEKNGVEFLNKLYKDLNLSDEVLHTSNGVKDKNEVVERYMERLERTHSRAIDNNKLDLLKIFYYKKYIVKEIDIPKYRDKERIINAQMESLDKWLDYLLDENAKYPMWAKYWAFQGMLKIGTYNEATGTYQKRSKKTLAPFIEINPEVLAKCIGMMVDYVDKNELSDDILNRLVESGNFQKLYTVLLKKHKSNLVDFGNKEDGKWVCYHYESEEEANEKEKNGIEPEYLKLYNSLQNYNTGWCTAGDKETAKNQICGCNSYEGGNFHVYYTKDKEDKYRVPRIAIRMDGINRVAEIRGIEDNQNLEEGLEKIVEDKLNSLNVVDVNKYLSIIYNMKKLTELTKKLKNNIEFTISDLFYIYSNNYIECFGWTDDPRLEKIRKARNKEEDFLKFSDDDLKIIIDKNASNFQYVSRNNKNYSELAKRIVNKFALNLKYVPTNIEGYKEIAKEAIKYDGRLLFYIPNDIDGYKEIAMIAIRQNGAALMAVPKDIEGYREIALEAVKQNGFAIKYVPKDIEGYREIVLEAVKQNSEALKFVPKDVEGYEEIVINIIKEKEQRKISSNRK